MVTQNTGLLIIAFYLMLQLNLHVACETFSFTQLALIAVCSCCNHTASIMIGT